MREENFIEKQEDSIVIHVFTVSAAMIGVCLTVIGILNVTNTLKKIETIGDDITAIDALIFLSACFMAFIAMRTRDRKRRLSLEKRADVFFLTGLSMMVLICFLIVYKLV